MFNNIGGKIKTLSETLCYIGMAGSVIGGIAVAIMEDVLVGIIILVIGSLVSWIGSFFGYGFGQLIQNSDKIVDSINSGNNGIAGASKIGDSVSFKSVNVKELNEQILEITNPDTDEEEEEEEIFLEEDEIEEGTRRVIGALNQALVMGQIDQEEYDRRINAIISQS